MALINDPALLIMDEPTTALDVTIEAAVLDLVNELQQELDTAIIYVSHDMGVIARVADRVGVMYAGEIVEEASVREIFLSPAHPYTRGLMRCLPGIESTRKGCTLYSIRGRVPSGGERLPGCSFEPRCNFAQEVCAARHPELRQFDGDRWVRCFFSQQVTDSGWHGADELAPEASDALRSERGHEQGLRVRRLRTFYEHESRSVLSLVGLHRKQYVHAVDGISFEIPRGITLGVVGESGCGKTTLARTIVGLEEPADGTIEFLGWDITTSVGQRDIEVIREIQMVFQNPEATLNPCFTVGYQIGRALRCLRAVPSDRTREEVERLLVAVKLDESYFGRLPRHLSGGEKQRVAIARAFASHPELVACDEPVASLDVSVRAAVLNLLTEIQRQHQTTLMYISHDLSLVRFISDVVAVVYLGRICEIGPARAVYDPPSHPYTEALLSAIAVPDPTKEQRRIRLSGPLPNALDPPKGCAFHSRCPRKVGVKCEMHRPQAQYADDDHRIYCHIPNDKLRKLQLSG
jgi:peptide/nickel transport system ATP-binding protein